MHNDLQQLLSAPLSQRSLHSLAAAAMRVAESSPAPLGYYVVASIASDMAAHDAGVPVDADAAGVRDEIMRPLLADVLAAVEAGGGDRLMSAVNAAISASLLTR